MDSNKLYLVSDEYIDFLSKANPQVMSNKQHERTYHRKYLGLVTEFNDFKYFVPLSSPKEKDYFAGTKKVKKDSLTTIYGNFQKPQFLEVTLKMRCCKSC